MTLVNKSFDLLNFRITYKEAPIHLLEKFAFKDVNSAHETFLEHLQMKECLILQTCNRVEIFAVIEEELNLQKIISYWADHSKLSTEEFSKIVEIVRGEEVIRHRCRLLKGRIPAQIAPRATAPSVCSPATCRQVRKHPRRADEERLGSRAAS